MQHASRVHPSGEQDVANASTEPVPDAAGRPPRGVSAAGFFALSFGAVVGSGWIVVLGQWLSAAGPIGTAIGFLCGGLAMIAIGLCYGELAARFPVAGGEFVYVLSTLGRLPAFIMGWFLTLYAIAICAFESIVLAWLFSVLVPGIQGLELYSILGSPVRIDGVTIGVVGVLMIGAVHALGVTSAIGFQQYVTFGFLATLVTLVVAGVSLGSMANWQPLFASRPNSTVALGVLWVFSSCAYFLNGWQTALHAIEERAPGVSVRDAVLAMVVGILVAALAYCGMVLSAAAAAPWPAMVSQELPAVAAFNALHPSGLIGVALVVIVLVAVVKTWNSIAWLATRLIVAQAREGFLPAVFARIDARSGAPRAAVVLVTGLSLAGPVLGRGLIAPIVNMVAICLALSILLCLAVLVSVRRSRPSFAGFAVPGGAATIAAAATSSALMIGVALVQPFLEQRGTIPVEWKLLALWLALGLVAWALFGRRRIHTVEGLSREV